MRETMQTPGETAWFTKARFGLFLHWGLYSMGARHEWLMHNASMPVEEYKRRYLEHFDPDLYDPEQWASAATDAGMRYFIVGAKHHDGFCLWDSKLTDFKAPNTPAGRDLIRPMIDAFRARDMGIGLYYSLIDWHHPHYHIDPHIGPYRNHPDRDKLNAKRDHRKYIEYLHGQVRELLSEFGRIDIGWFDFSFPHREPEGKGREAWDSDTLYRIIRELQPHIILNDRLDLDSGWDVKTPEQFQPREWLHVDGQPVVWEACHTFSGSWGYHRDESTWKSTGQLVRMLIDCVSKGGNLLLNVGPTGRGEFDARSLDRLKGIGRWMKYHSRSIYGCTEAPSEFSAPPDCRLTYNPETNRLYVHVFAWPFKHLHLDGQAFVDRVAYAQLLNDGSEVPYDRHDGPKKKRKGGVVKMTAPPDMLSLYIPTQAPDVEVPVIELILK